MHPIPATTAHHDRQDVVNHLLAAALHARATLEQTRRTIDTPPGLPQAAADLTDAATALAHIEDLLLDVAAALDTPNSSDPR